MKVNNMTIALPVTTVTVKYLTQVLDKLTSVRATLDNDFGIITAEWRDGGGQPIIRVSLNYEYNDLIFTNLQNNTPLHVVFTAMYKDKLAHPVMDKLFRHCILLCEVYEQTINKISGVNEDIENLRQQINKAVGGDVTICEKKQEPHQRS